MFRTTLLAGLLSLALSLPAQAQQCWPFDLVMQGEFQARGLPVAVMSPEVLEKAKGLFQAEDATRGFVAQNEQGVFVVGLEVDGCLLPPIYLEDLSQFTLMRLSGRYSFGTFA